MANTANRYVTISYRLNPPITVDSGSLNPSKDEEFLVRNGSAGQKEYYTNLQLAIEEARNKLGEELTAWRDAVGSAEQGKETKKTMKYEDEDADDDDEDEDETET